MPSLSSAELIPHNSRFPPRWSRRLLKDGVTAGTGFLDEHDGFSGVIGADGVDRNDEDVIHGELDNLHRGVDADIESAVGVVTVTSAGNPPFCEEAVGEIVSTSLRFRLRWRPS